MKVLSQSHSIVCSNSESYYSAPIWRYQMYISMHLNYTFQCNTDTIIPFEHFYFQLQGLTALIKLFMQN